MVALADVITHGCNAVRYSVDKEKSEVVMVHCLPENITPSSMWDRMLILQQKYREKINRYNHLYKTAIRIEVSPAKEETEKLVLGAEIVQGTLERQVDVHVGDDMRELMNVEVLVEDDKIVAIRG